jgi:hypothetical protein
VINPETRRVVSRAVVNLDNREILVDSRDNNRVVNLAGNLDSRVNRGKVNLDSQDNRAILEDNLDNKAILVSALGEQVGI